MKKYFTLLALSFLVLSADAKSPKVLPLEGSFQDYQAVALANHLKRMETMGGFVRWLEEVHPEEKVTEFKAHLMKLGITDDQFFPNFQVKGNTIRYGRNSLTIHKDHVVINKHKFPIKQGQSLVEFSNVACKKLKCEGQTALYDSLVFGEAHAIADWLLYSLIFSGGYVIGRWGWPWQWGIFRRWGRKAKNAAQNVTQQVYRTTTYDGGWTAGSTVERQEVLSAVANGGKVQCMEDGTSVLCSAPQGSPYYIEGGGCRIIPAAILDKDMECSRQAAAISTAAKANVEKYDLDGPLPGAVPLDQVRTTESVESPKEPMKKKPWSGRLRW